MQIMVTAEKSKKRQYRKYNWGPIEADMDRGVPNGEIAEKYSVPVGRIIARKRERRMKLAESVLLHANDGVGEVGRPAPSPQNVVIVSRKQEISEVSAPNPAELTEDQLVTLLSDPQAVLSLSASDAEKLMARALQLKCARGLAMMRDPESPKEFGPMAKLFREMSGLTGDKGKGGSGLLSPQRAYGRRSLGHGEIREAVVIDRGGLEEPEGGWPEGM